MEKEKRVMTDLYLEEANVKIRIRKENIACHLDIDRYLKDRNSGQVTFTIRVNAGEIVDFVETEYVPVKQKYFTPLKTVAATPTSTVPDNVSFHIILENEVSLTPYGTITVNVEVKGGKALVGTMNIVKMNRVRYFHGEKNNSSKKMDTSDT